MPRLILTDELWSKLKAILLEDRVYNKLEHRKRWKELFIDCVSVVLGVICPNILVYGIRFIVDFCFGLKKAY